MKRKLLMLALLLAMGTVQSETDQLEATWNPSTDAAAIGTRFYEVRCPLPWTGDITKDAQCAGVIDGILLVDRGRVPGANECPLEWNEVVGSCYHYIEDTFFTGRTGVICFAATAYSSTSQIEEFGPIHCKPVEENPEPEPEPEVIASPLLIDIKLICKAAQEGEVNPDCTVHIVE